MLKPMPTVNDNKENKEVGRPTLYKAEYCNQAYQLCLIGYTDEGLAKFFGIAESTLYSWKNEYPEFSDSIRSGKEFADMEVVHELFKGTKDKVVIEQQAFKVKTVSWDDKGRKCEKESVEVIELEKVIPADFRNQQFWLKNRQKVYWRDKIETGITDTDGNDIKPLTDSQVDKILTKLNEIS